MITRRFVFVSSVIISYVVVSCIILLGDDESFDVEQLHPSQSSDMNCG